MLKEFISLKILDKFKFIFEKIGIDYIKMRKILQLKLTLDSRRVPTIMNNQNKEYKDDENVFIKSLISYALVGIVVMLFMFLNIPLFIKMSISFGMIIFMIMATMVADFSSVLLDVKDKNILLSKPVDSLTINTARTIHIFIYLFIITMVISGPALIVGGVKHGLGFVIIFFVDLILIDSFIIFLTSLLYSFILKFFDGEKLKDIINNVQIVLSIAMVLAYQVVGRVFNFLDYEAVLDPKWWIYLVPPAWFAAPFELFLTNNYNSQYIYLSIVCILASILSLVIYIKVVIPYFERNLSKLNSDEGKSSRLVEVKEKFYRSVFKIFTRSKIENTFCRFSLKLLSKDRKIKLKIYPSLVFATIFPFIAMLGSFGRGNSFTKSIAEISSGNLYYSMYIAILMLSTTTAMTTFSESYKGAWIYRTLPIENPSIIYSSALKSYFLKYSIPIYVFISTIFILIYGVNIIFHIILMFLNMVLISILVFKFTVKDIPFSKGFENIKENNILALVTAVGSGGVLAGIHIFLDLKTRGLIILSGITLLIIVFVWKVTFKMKWEDILDS